MGSDLPQGEKRHLRKGCARNLRKLDGNRHFACAGFAQDARALRHELGFHARVSDSKGEQGLVGANTPEVKRERTDSSAE